MFSSKNHILNLLVAVVLSISLLATDIIYSILESKYNYLIDLKSFLFIFLISLLITYLKNRVFINIIIITFFTLIFLQLSHFSFFGSLVDPHGIILIFSEMDEIYETLNETIIIFYKPFYAVSIPFILSLIFVNLKFNDFKKISFLSLVLILLLSFLPIKAFYSKTSERFMPKTDSFALKNMLYSTSYFLGKDLIEKLVNNRPIKVFKPYKVNSLERKNANNKNIILILGESLSYTHMSLFGYERETTPKLDSLKNDNSFRYKKAISSAVYTKVSLPMFFNVQREPENFLHMLNKTSNLFKLAKSKGFQTHFYSKQKNKLVANSLSPSDIDYFKSSKDYEKYKFDTALLNDLDLVDFNKNNFIVLHQRATHTPYEYNYTSEFNKFKFDKSNYHEYMNNSYDNSVLFTDSFIYDVINKVKSKTLNNTENLIFFVPDHGEMLGENGKYGHSKLDLNCAKIPFLYYGLNTEFTKNIDEYNNLYTHYDIAKLISKSIGFEIFNPNDDNETFYLNGTGLMGESGYLEFNKYKILDKL